MRLMMRLSTTFNARQATSIAHMHKDFLQSRHRYAVPAYAQHALFFVHFAEKMCEFRNSIEGQPQRHLATGST